ncbi:Predicted oxidoreductase [Actinacidiphila yanglinensis]|uniref:Predicted oxidoreductase n=1 Tax=Actinacidiphila yanglinensis TaxID=310779 RepID=A0A1H6C5F7_9ACTN|nr:aldo/keto reductase [Actinacidiphila yanglinensis]SEG68201.1 Predicted oxidoreductase [Actinacidiphila yanglinensis]
MTWIASTLTERRAQLGRFVLGTGIIGGVATQTGPGLGLSDSEGIDLIDRAVAEGFRVIDTADVYTGGNSERVVGVWNKAQPDSGMLIQSKTGFTSSGPDLSPERVARQLQHSVDTLGRVDLYFAHTVDPNTPWSESLPVFSSAVESGRIRAYGLSNVDRPALESALEAADRLGLVRPELIQNSYSLIVRGDDLSVLPIARAEGLAYTAYSPLANGILAGRYSRGEQPEKGSRASTGRRTDEFLGDPGLMKRVEAFDRLAAEQGVTPAGLALAWLANHPQVAAPVIGVSKESQWQGIHEALGLQWTPELSARLDELFPAA